MLQEDHSANASGLFNSLPEHSKNLFFSTITEKLNDNDIKRSMNDIQQVQPNTNIVTMTAFTLGNALKFYYRTRIMKANDDGIVLLETVDSPNTPDEGKFIHEHCKDQFCTTSHLRNETKSLYVVLSYKDLQLKCVDKDGMNDANLHTFITIYSTNLVNPGDPDTALYFPAQEDGKGYHYYLIPMDSPHPESTIKIEKVCIDKLTNEQLEEMNRKHLVFTQSYHNKGSVSTRCNRIAPSSSSV